MKRIKDPNVYKDNSYIFEFAVWEPRAADGVLIPSHGLINLAVYIGATEDGASPIHADLQVTAAERSGLPGIYWGEVPGAEITEHMFGTPSFDKQSVYIFGASMTSGTPDGNVKVVEKVKAFAVRRVAVAT